MGELSTLSALLRHAAEQNPAGIAFIERERRTSYAAFAQLVQRTAAWLHRAGIGPGSRIAIWLPNRLEWLALVFAAARLGAAIVAVNTRFRSAEVTFLLQKSKATWLVLQPDFRRIDFASVLASVDGTSLPNLDQVVVVDTRDAGAKEILGRRVRPFTLDDLPDDRVR